MDVAVVGGGPVGLVTALLLDRHGVRCEVYEREPTSPELPRAVHLDDEALRVLSEVGVGEEINADGRPVAGMSLVDARLEPFLTFARDPSPGPLGFPASVLVHQPDVDARLRAAAAQRGLLRPGAEVTGLEQGADGVTLTIAEQGRSTRCTARYAVGCDGAHSDVRAWAGIGDCDLGGRQRWFIVDLRVEGEPDHPNRVLQICDPRGPATSVPVGGGRHRFELMIDRDEGGTLDRDELVRTTLDRCRPWIGDTGVWVERAVPYTFRARLAQQFRRDRVLLAGDAAHEMPPFLGQGLCAGLRDAANLAWRLALVTRGQAEEAVLDGYDAERRAHVGEVIAVSRRVGRIVADRRVVRSRLRRGALAAVGRVVRDRGGLGGVQMPALPSGAFVDASPRGGAGGPPGRPVPRPTVRAAGRVEPLDRLMGPGFGVLGIGVDPRAGLPLAVRRWWEDLGARFVALDADPRDAAGIVYGQDLSGTLLSWATTHEVALVVVRPDRTVLGAYPATPAGELSPLAELTSRLRRAGVRG